VNCTDCPFKPVVSESCGLYHKEAEVCETKEKFMKAFAEALFKEQFGDLVVARPIGLIEHMKLTIPEKLPYRFLLAQTHPLTPNQIAIVRNEEKENV